jgi:hypothetical protein
MECSALDQWWKENIEVNNPDRLKMHKLELTGERPERVQIFARIEDEVDDKRVKDIIKLQLEPNFSKFFPLPTRS